MLSLFGARFGAPGTYTPCTYSTGNPYISGEQVRCATYAKPEVDIDSNPEGSGTHQVDSTCNTLGRLGSTEAID